ncbi:hypothetical protein AAOE16_02795 [Ekhidna sp. MALMAid0563]|uniref:hypothetical protein n=1 Tax=Ekhidna sp. MALMAid0563 TaxID=3143937 RepID=UPI0032E03C33
MVEVGFYILTVIMVFTPLIILQKSDEPPKRKKAYSVIIIMWFIYITTLSNSGWLDDFGFPPRVPLLIVIPAVLFIISYTSKKWVKDSIMKVKDHQIIYIQSFRIAVELLIYGGFLNEVFPKKATFEGLNYDILVGASALIIGALVQKGILKSKGILIWNILSLAILSVTVFSFVSSYYFSDIMSENFQFVRLPYVFLASILLPMAVFYHVISIRQQLMKSHLS